MSVLIKGIFGKERPIPQEGYIDVRLHFRNGRIECATMQTGNRPFYATFKVVELPPHGRLIDADMLKSKFRHGKGDDDVDSAWISTIRRFITQADTIIGAEGNEVTK